MKTKTKTNTTNNNTTAPAVVPTATAAVGSGFTLGLDLGDRSHYVCVLDAAGQIRHEAALPNDRAALTLLLTKHPAATVALGVCPPAFCFSSRFLALPSTIQGNCPRSTAG